ncbi:MAG: hypothetical protein N4A72_17270 [Bacteroidales bacterium]|jgi:hypothetical protein|nr:hypothetical protein [Bacteroidales bacterium]
MNNLLSFDVVDLTELNSTSLAAVESGCGGDNGNCGSGCGCGGDDGNCGSGSTHEEPEKTR